MNDERRRAAAKASQQPARGRRGFSLVELIVVLGVAVLMTSMLLPAMSQLKESAHRLICASNQRQLGQAMFMYAHDNNDQLPKSEVLRGPHKKPQELMRSFDPVTAEWDGWGVLFEFRYCGAVECFYCPSHQGQHPMERYYQQWYFPTNKPIYTNYHYSGDVYWNSNTMRSLNRGSEQALATDGLRTASDFNHVTGMNVLHGDGAVRWVDDADEILKRLPDGPIDPEEQAGDYSTLWEAVEANR